MSFLLWRIQIERAVYGDGVATESFEADTIHLYLDLGVEGGREVKGNVRSVL